MVHAISKARLVREIAEERETEAEARRRKGGMKMQGGAGDMAVRVDDIKRGFL